MPGGPAKPTQQSQPKARSRPQLRDECEDAPAQALAKVQPEQKPTRRQRRDDHRAPAVNDSLRTHLSQLDAVPSDRVFLVRKIQTLRLGSEETIQAHFAAYGAVDAVLVAHSHVMSSCQRFVRRVRPANLAIVIMGDASAAEAVLAQGREQAIAGARVVVEEFERRGAIAEAARRRIETWSVESTAVPSSGSSNAGDALDATSSVGDVEECQVPSDFEYCPTDDGF